VVKIEIMILPIGRIEILILRPKQNENRSSITNVYRVKLLSESVLQQLIDNKDGLISMNGFLSTTTDLKVAN
jgi:hypothetical protein